MVTDDFNASVAFAMNGVFLTHYDQVPRVPLIITAGGTLEGTEHFTEPFRKLCYLTTIKRHFSNLQLE